MAHKMQSTNALQVILRRMFPKDSVNCATYLNFRVSLARHEGPPLPRNPSAPGGHDLAVDEMIICVIHDIQFVQSPADDAAMHLSSSVRICHYRLQSSRTNIQHKPPLREWPCGDSARHRSAGPRIPFGIIIHNDSTE